MRRNAAIILPKMTCVGKKRVNESQLCQYNRHIAYIQSQNNTCIDIYIYTYILDIYTFLIPSLGKEPTRTRQVLFIPDFLRFAQGDGEKVPQIVIPFGVLIYHLSW